MAAGRSRGAVLAVVSVVAAGAFGALVLGSDSSTPTCTHVAALTGSDAAAGTSTAPFRTAGKLVASLGSGETGCLRAGVYAQDLAIAPAGITLTSYPGERATLTGRLWIKQGANGVTLRALNLDGKNAALLPSPTVNGDDDQFIGDDVTNDNTEICFLIGSSYGRAHRTLVQGNRIHNCGKLPSQNQDHGIYISEADDTKILDNVIVNNVDRGVQMYPDAQGTIIKGNVIDSNGEGIIFSGFGSLASSNNTVTGNLITHSKIRHDVESYWGSGTTFGTGNTAKGNCIFGGKEGTLGAQTGFTASNNAIVDPGYANAAAGDYRIAAASPCASVMAASLAPAGPNGEPPVIQPAPSNTTTTLPTTTPPPTTSTTSTTTLPATTTTVPAPPPWRPTVGARAKVTKASSTDFGKLGEVIYVSGDGSRAALLMDAVTLKPVLTVDIGAP